MGALVLYGRTAGPSTCHTDGTRTGTAIAAASIQRRAHRCMHVPAATPDPTSASTVNRQWKSIVLLSSRMNEPLPPILMIDLSTSQPHHDEDRPVDKLFNI